MPESYNAIPSQGVILEMSDDGTAFTEVAEITDLDGPNGSVSVTSTTPLKSTYATKMPNVIDSGQLSADLNLMPTDESQVGVREAYDKRTSHTFRITLTDEAKTTLTFQGFVSEFGITASNDDRVTAAATIEINGPVEWGANSGA